MSSDKLTAIKLILYAFSILKIGLFRFALLLPDADLPGFQITTQGYKQSGGGYGYCVVVFCTKLGFLLTGVSSDGWGKNSRT